MTEGWQCPVCGRGNAPWKSECECYLTDPRRMSTESTELYVMPNDARWSDNKTTWGTNEPTSSEETE